MERRKGKGKRGSGGGIVSSVRPIAEPCPPPFSLPLATCPLCSPSVISLSPMVDRRERERGGRKGEKRREKGRTVGRDPLLLTAERSPPSELYPPRQIEHHVSNLFSLPSNSRSVLGLTNFLPVFKERQEGRGSVSSWPMDTIGTPPCSKQGRAKGKD